ncbi:MAG TPA: TadE family protein [Syntrophales bacterium]|nr:TadE family protein [Syntrophales bacterium]
MKSVTKQEKGQSLVEFAILLPVFLLILVGIAEFGRGWMTKNILTGAAREGARVAAVQLDPAASGSQGKLAASGVLNSAGIPAPPAVVSVIDPGLSIPSIRVDVTYTYTVSVLNFVPGLPGPNINLAGTATMRRERY